MSDPENNVIMFLVIFVIENRFVQGIRDGVPIALGYLSVSFAFGMMAASQGLPLWASVVISFTNLTSAGQFAALGIIASAGSMLEMALSQLIINLRYFLMSLSLTQKVDPKMNTLQRAVIAHGVTDEIFAVSTSRYEGVGFTYMIALMMLPILGWTGGTFLGGAASSLLPLALRDALGIMIYGMFLAIILPPCRRSREIFIVVILSSGDELSVSAAFFHCYDRQRFCDHSLYIGGGRYRRLAVSGHGGGWRCISLLGYMAVMAGVTYLIRCLPLLCFRRRIRNRYIQSFLYYVPYAVLGSMTFPAIFRTSTGSVVPSCRRLCGCRRARLSGKEPAAGGARRFGRCLSDDADDGDGILRKRNTSIFLMLFFYTFGSGHAILKLDEKNSGNLHRFNIGMNISLRLSWHNTNVKDV